jgi:hypothetical protein
MKNLKQTLLVFGMTIACFSNTQAQSAKTININNTMPNRISMTTTVGKQNMMVAIIDGGCVITFPPHKAYRVNSATNTMTEISKTESNRLINEGKQTNATTFGDRVNSGGTVVSGGAGVLGGSVPGSSIVSAAVSSGSSMANSGASSAAYARTNTSGWDLKTNQTRLQLPDNLPDGDYELTFVFTSGLRDTLKTQVRLGFSLEQGILKTKHDTVKNSISNVR